MLTSGFKGAIILGTDQLVIKLTGISQLLKTVDELKRKEDGWAKFEKIKTDCNR